MDHVRVPEPSGSPEPPRRVLRPLQDEFGTNTLYRRTDIQEALKYSRNLDEGMLDRIKNALDSMWPSWPSDQYERWLEWHVEKEWQEHIERLHGLVQAENIPQIAKILRKTPEELEAVNDEAGWKPAETCSNPTKLHKQMFAVDVALRGIYYDKLTELARRRRILHPIRRTILDPPAKTVCYPDPVLPYLVAILGNYACLKKGKDYYKLKAWTTVLVESRRSYRARIKEPRSASNPKQMAITIAKEAGVTNPLRLKFGWEKAFEHAPSVGTGIAIGIYLHQYGLPEALTVGSEFVGHLAAGLVIDAALNKTLNVVAKSDFRIGSLADKGKWFGGRVFSYQSYQGV